jgi:hypothetical protein
LSRSAARRPHRQRTARSGELKGFLQRLAGKVAGEETGIEAVAGAHGVDFVDRDRR